MRRDLDSLGPVTGRARVSGRATRTPILGGPSLDRRLAVILVLYLVVVVSIIGYGARQVSRQRGSATVVNVAARQRALAERYVKDVLLRTQGVQADPQDDADQLLANADALISGGGIVAVQGIDRETRIPPATDPLVIAKLDEERDLIRTLIATGDRLSRMHPSDPGFSTQLLELRIVGGQVTSISNDAVGQMTENAEAAFARLVAVTVALGALGAVAAITMGFLMRRAGAQRSAQFRSLVHHGSDLITVVDELRQIRYQSPSAERLVGRRAEDTIGAPYEELIEADDRSRVVTLLGDVATSAGGSATAEYRIRHGDGSFRYVESIVSNLLADPSVRGLVLNTRDVTDRRMLEEELAHQAFHDSLTGLFNRAVFRDRLDHALTRSVRSGHRPAVLLLDLDGFKTINDSLGHDAGDDLLIAVGERIRSCGRLSDTVARLGGDEFAILLEDDIDERRARGVAERIEEALTDPFEVRGREVFVRASVGIALPGDETVVADDLIRNADTAMYAAKGGGRGRYEFFRPSMHERALEEFEVQADLQQALARDELTVHYQPVVDFGSTAVQGVEALVRWNHPTRGLLPPGAFIRIAEETGLIVPIGRWVLQEACRRTVAWRARYPEAKDLWVSVNLSTRQLVEADLVDQVRDVLRTTGLDPASLTLEITEGSLMQDVPQTIRKLQDLKSLGVRLAIDDFGTGSSSLGYLRQFPIDLLKIDKSFVDEVANSGSQGPALVRAIVDLAHTLHLETVAEGIEQDDQLAELRSIGCRTGQGFLFARPLRTEDLESLFEDGGRTSPSLADRAGHPSVSVLRSKP